MLSQLYAITDRSMIQKSLSDDIKAAIIGGAAMIQLREKNISEEEYTAYAEEALAVCRKYGARLIINDNISVCKKSGADGVHLGQRDGSPAEARKILGRNAIIGVTAKTAAQAEKAYADGASYIGSGAVFGTSTKHDAANMTIDALRAITAASKLPVYAIGGINISNISRLNGCGVYGVAVVSGIFKGNIRQNAESLSEAVREL